MKKSSAICSFEFRSFFEFFDYFRFFSLSFSTSHLFHVNSFFFDRDHFFRLRCFLFLSDFFHLFDLILFMFFDHCLNQNTFVCEFIFSSIIFFAFFLRVSLVIFVLNSSLIEF